MSAPLPPPRPVTVRGGQSALDVRLHDVIALAETFSRTGSACAAAAYAARAVLDDPDLEASALFDVTGYVAFAEALVDAVGLSAGLGRVVLEADDLAHDLRRAVQLYEHADHLFGGGAPEWLVGILRLPVAQAAALTTLATTHDVGASWQSAIAVDPQLGDTVMSMLIGLDGVLAQVLPDGRGVAHDTGVDADGVAGRAPRMLSDVVGDLGRRSDDARHGEIDVRILTMADGTRRVIVDITGTKSWDPLPTHDVTSLSTNERALVGRRTAYEQGVLTAMRRAGVGSHDDVMIVGHSEGGMVAVNAARDADRSGEFRITHVITAGSPVGRTVGALPSNVQVLALENRTDVVPHLDAARNPARANITTVTGHRGDGTVVGDHDVDTSYLPIAGDTQASRATAVTQYLRSAGGYFSATAVTTHTYQIERSYR